MEEVKLSEPQEKEVEVKEEKKESSPTFQSTKPKRNQLAAMMDAFRAVVIIMLITALAYISWAIYDGLKNTVDIETRNNPPACQHDSCIAFHGTYKDGAATWEVQKGWPLKLLVQGTQFSQNDIPVVIRCPITPNTNETLTKISFLFAQEKLNQCTVTSK